MIIWINGTYGIGKTAISQRIKEQLPANEVALFNADDLDKKLLQDTIKECIKNNTFPDIENVSPQNDIKFINHFYQLIKDECIYSNKILLVDMAITTKLCKEQLFDSLIANNFNILHIILTANLNTIKTRIKYDNNRDKQFALDELNECFNFLNDNFKNAIRVNTENKTINEIANEIIQIINEKLPKVY